MEKFRIQDKNRFLKIVDQTIFPVFRRFRNTIGQLVAGFYRLNPRVGFARGNPDVFWNQENQKKSFKRKIHYLKTIPFSKASKGLLCMKKAQSAPNCAA